MASVLDRVGTSGPGLIARSVLPGWGIGPMRFGMSCEDVFAFLGAPSERAGPDKEGDIRWRYGGGTSGFHSVDLYFEAEEKGRLGVIEVTGPEGLFLFGESLRNWTADRLIELASEIQLGFEPEETCATDGTLSETSLTLPVLSLTMYYSPSGDVAGVSIGPFVSADDSVMWPWPIRSKG